MALFGAPATVVTASAQFTSFEAHVVSVPTPGTAVNLPALAIPNGATLAIKAKTSNHKNSSIFVGNVSPILAAERITLAPGDSISLNITNADAVWIDTTHANSAVELLVEQ